MVAKNLAEYETLNLVCVPYKFSYILTDVLCTYVRVYVYLLKLESQPVRTSKKKEKIKKKDFKKYRQYMC